MASKKDAADLAKYYLEIGVDHALEMNKQYLPALASVAEEVPFIRTLLFAMTAPQTLADQILGYKVSKFLFASNLDEKSLAKLRKKLRTKKFEKVLKRVVLALEAHDDEEKSIITGKLFKALMDDHITPDEFFSMVHITNSLNLTLLPSLKNHYMLNPSQISGNRTLFVTLGLLNINESGIGTLGGGGPTYPINMLGWKYVGIVFNFPESSIKGIKIGQSELYHEVTEGGIPSDTAYPLEKLQKEDRRYSRVDVYVVNAEYQIACKNGIPFRIGSVIPTIAHSFDDAVEAIINENNLSDQTHFKPVNVRFEDNVFVRSYAVVTKPDEIGEEFINYIDAKNNLHNAKEPASIPDTLFVLIDDLLKYKSEIPDYFST